MKRLACGRNVRYAIDIFVKLYTLVPQDGWARQSTLLQSISGVIQTKLKKFSDVVMMFGNVILQNQTDENSWNSTFERALEFLRKVMPRGTTLTAPKTPPLNVSTALTQLSETTTTDEAIQLFWGSQELVWKNLKITDLAVIDALNEMTKKLSESDRNFILQKAENPNEMAYLSGTVEVGRVFKQKSTERYQKCTWLMYNSEQSEIRKIESDLEKHWPNKTRPSRIDEFCFRFSKWYQLLSDADFHVPESASLPQSCRPNTQDYEEYLNSVAAKEKDNDMCAVGLILKGLYSYKAKPA